MEQLSAKGIAVVGAVQKRQEAARDDIEGYGVVVVRPPAFMDNGLLRLSGFFPSAPEQVNFDLAFQSVEGRWLLFAVALNTSPSVTAQAPPGPMPATPFKQAPVSGAAGAGNPSAAPPGKVPGWVFSGVNTDPSAVGETAPAPGAATGKPAPKR
jgi:hypothetical protein